MKNVKRILCCVGTRPNFIKVVLLRKLFGQRGFEYRLLHTGQHFDDSMSKIFFDQLQMGEPEFYLGIGGGTNSEVVGKIIMDAEKIMMEYKPDLVIVPGDVNSTFACAFAAASLRIPVAHIESGLRSFDMDMPEERNRILTDSLSDLLFITEPAGLKILRESGFKEEKLKMVGNTIIDALKCIMPLVETNTIEQSLGISDKFCLVTFHRPVNVDNETNLRILCNTLERISSVMQVVFPVHPRTRKQMAKWGLLKNESIVLTAPLGYIEFLALMRKSCFVLSDSGGVQIESSYFNVPCFTARDTAELKITIEEGTNTLVPLNEEIIFTHVLNTLSGNQKVAKPQWLWDGKSSERIVDECARYLAI